MLFESWISRKWESHQNRIKKFQRFLFLLPKIERAKTWFFLSLKIEWEETQFFPFPKIERDSDFRQTWLKKLILFKNFLSENVLGSVKSLTKFMWCAKTCLCEVNNLKHFISDFLDFSQITYFRKRFEKKICTKISSKLARKCEGRGGVFGNCVAGVK